MSAYRPPHRQNWREREAQREAARKEEELKRKTELNAVNFPPLTKTLKFQATPAGSQFATLAEKWAKSDEVDRRMEEYHRHREMTEQLEAEQIRARRLRFDRSYDEVREEEEEDDYMDTPSAPKATNSMLDLTPQQKDDDGWTEVKRKTRKPKRELTIDELEAADRAHAAVEQEEEFNAHLFDSNRHDHDRV